jgi:Pyruvate/2-oxoacid:ferredoxin oxidoreductase gamma subunit
MLGAFIKKSRLVSLDTILEALKSTLGNKVKLMTVNRDALRAGYDLF